jgi:hypothetical protein
MADTAMRDQHDPNDNMIPYTLLAFVIGFLLLLAFIYA